MWTRSVAADVPSFRPRFPGWSAAAGQPRTAARHSSYRSMISPLPYSIVWRVASPDTWPTPWRPPLRRCLCPTLGQCTLRPRVAFSHSGRAGGVLSPARRRISTSLAWTETPCLNAWCPVRTTRWQRTARGLRRTPWWWSRNRRGTRRRSVGQPAHPARSAASLRRSRPRPSEFRSAGRMRTRRSPCSGICSSRRASYRARCSPRWTPLTVRRFGLSKWGLGWSCCSSRYSITS